MTVSRTFADRLRDLFADVAPTSDDNVAAPLLAALAERDRPRPIIINITFAPTEENTCPRQ